MILYVDVLDACNLRCRTCVRGLRGLKNSARQMPLDKFEHIVAKAVSDGFDSIQLFNWTEPFLLDNLHEYASIVRRYGFPCICSSNLSIKHIGNFREALASIDALTVSVSGLDQEVYEVNHAGGSIELVKRNLSIIADLKRAGAIATCVQLKFIRFDYNRDQESRLRDYAMSLGLEFAVTEGSGHPVTGDPRQFTEEHVWAQLRCFDAGRFIEHRGEVCAQVFDNVSLDVAGDVFLCCARPNYGVFRVGPYLELSMSEILITRHSHPMCPSCGFQRREATALEKQALREAFDQSLVCTDPKMQRHIPSATGAS